MSYALFDISVCFVPVTGVLSDCVHLFCAPILVLEYFAYLGSPDVSLAMFTLQTLLFSLDLPISMAQIHNNK